MNKEEVYDFLKKNNIKFEVDEHILVFNMNDLKRGIEEDEYIMEEQ